jgi:hypothetical protein
MIKLLFKGNLYLLTCLLLLILVSAVSAQSSISGKIIATDTKNPVALANVFLANTTIGTTSKEDGSFILTDIPDGQYELIVSYIGCESYVHSFRTRELPLVLDVSLNPKVVELQEVVVGAYEKNGWEKWGELFLEHFIGTSLFAEETQIVNKGDLRFRFDAKTNTLSVVALDRVVIQNKALGYTLRYQLEKFEYDTARHVFHFKGYPFFEEMTTTRASLREKWVERRNAAYHGSIMHFMRSLYSDSLKENGFEVRKKLLVTEEEKKRVKIIWAEIERVKKIASILPNKQQLYNDNYNGDSISYFEHVVAASPGTMIVPNIKVPRDSIAFRLDDQSMVLFFNSMLEVRYPSKKFPREYARASADAIPNRQRFSSLMGDPLFSDMLLKEGSDPVTVYANGSYSNGMTLNVGAYWAWWEKMADKLPYEYQPLPAVKK